MYNISNMDSETSTTRTKEAHILDQYLSRGLTDGLIKFNGINNITELQVTLILI